MPVSPSWNDATTRCTTTCLELTGKDDPVVLFVPTATGDDASYIVKFYEAFHSGRCRPRHLRLFHRDFDDLTDLILESDVIHVGGGNTANMLDVWRRQGVDELLHRALAGGAVLTGGSAGGLCWFEGGTTDSFGPTLQLLHDGLGMIKGSYCPHYDAEDQRRPLFHAALLDGSLEMGYASWNRVAIRFTPEGDVVEAVTSEPGGRALKVYARDGRSSKKTFPAVSSKSASRAAACRPESPTGSSRSIEPAAWTDVMESEPSDQPAELLAFVVELGAAMNTAGQPVYVVAGAAHQGRRARTAPGRDHHRLPDLPDGDDGSRRAGGDRVDDSARPARRDSTRSRRWTGCCSRPNEVRIRPTEGLRRLEEIRAVRPRFARLHERRRLLPCWRRGSV